MWGRAVPGLVCTTTSLPCAKVTYSEYFACGLGLTFQSEVVSLTSLISRWIKKTVGFETVRKKWLQTFHDGKELAKRISPSLLMALGPSLLAHKTQCHAINPGHIMSHGPKMLKQKKKKKDEKKE